MPSTKNAHTPRNVDNQAGAGSMSTDTITTADLVTGATPTCARCHQSDRRGLTGWLGIGLCGLCLLMAKARAHHNDEKEKTA